MYFKLIIFLLRSVVKYLVIVMPVEMAGVVLLPFILPFISKDKEQLPWWCRWFDNQESWRPAQFLRNGGTIDGLMGPNVYREPRGLLASQNPGYFKILFNRWWWLAIRNPAYYYKWYVVGENWRFNTMLKSPTKAPYNLGVGPGNVLGWYFQESTKGPFEEFYGYFKWCSKYCLRVRIGYKVGNFVNIKYGDAVQLEFAINPFYSLNTVVGIT